MAEDEELTPGDSGPVAAAEAGTSSLILTAGTDDDIQFTERFVDERAPEDLLLLAGYSERSDAVDRFADITVDGRKRLLTAGQDGEELTIDDALIQTLADPYDLSTVGIKISSFLDDDGGTVVCLYSLTALLETVGVERLLRFLQILTNRIAAADAVGQFYLDRSEHDDQTIYMLQSVFEDVVETGTTARFSY